MVIRDGESIEIVNNMSLEEGHVLTEEEAWALHDVLQDAFSLRVIRRELGIEED